MEGELGVARVILFQKVSSTNTPDDFDVPFSHSINLQIDPPDAGSTYYTPQRGLLAKRTYWHPLEEEKVCEGEAEDDGYSYSEEKDMKR